jgi:hypothetical protein
MNPDRKAERAHKKAAKKAYDRNHAQLKRQQAFHAVLLASQLKRARKQAKRDAR